MHVACFDSVNTNEYIHVKCTHIHVFVTTVAEIQVTKTELQCDYLKTSLSLPSKNKQREKSFFEG
ncbi:hypothetical protein AMTRI_Chr13g83530 [Amborella trichopoda]